MVEFRCPECTKAFASLASVNAHSRRHCRPSRKRQYAALWDDDSSCDIGISAIRQAKRLHDTGLDQSPDTTPPSINCTDSTPSPQPAIPENSVPTSTNWDQTFQQKYDRFAGQPIAMILCKPPPKYSFTPFQSEYEYDYALKLLEGNVTKIFIDSWAEGDHGKKHIEGT